MTFLGCMTLAYSVVPPRKFIRKEDNMITFSAVQTFFMVLLAISSALITFGGAINILSNWKKQSKVERHDGEIKDHEKRIQKLEEKTKEQDGFIKVLCNSILALVSHEINGNSLDKLKDAQKELQDFLINKQEE